MSTWTTSPTDVVSKNHHRRKLNKPQQQRRLPAGVVELSTLLYCGECTSNSQKIPRKPPPPPPPPPSYPYAQMKQQQQQQQQQQLQQQRTQAQKEQEKINDQNQAYLPQHLLEPGESNIRYIHNIHDNNNSNTITNTGNNLTSITTTTITHTSTVTPQRRMVRTTLEVEGICCATEVATIQKIFRDMNNSRQGGGVGGGGVGKVKPKQNGNGTNNTTATSDTTVHVSIATKQVYVKHDESRIPPPMIATILTNSGFPAFILHVTPQHQSDDANNNNKNHALINDSVLQKWEEDGSYQDTTTTETVGESILEASFIVVQEEDSNVLLSYSSSSSYSSSRASKAELFLLQKKFDLETILQSHTQEEKIIYKSYKNRTRFPITIAQIQKSNVPMQQLTLHPFNEYNNNNNNNPNHQLEENIERIRISIRHDCSRITSHELLRVIDKAIPTMLLENIEHKQSQQHQQSPLYRTVQHSTNDTNNTNNSKHTMNMKKKTNGNGTHTKNKHDHASSLSYVTATIVQDAQTVLASENATRLFQQHQDKYKHQQNHSSDNDKQSSYCYTSKTMTTPGLLSNQQQCKVHSNNVPASRLSENIHDNDQLIRDKYYDENGDMDLDDNTNSTLLLQLKKNTERKKLSTTPSDSQRGVERLRTTSPLLSSWDIQKLKVHVYCSGIFWILSVISNVMEYKTTMMYFGLLSSLFGLPPVAIKAFQKLKRLQFDANCMMVLAAVGALALEEYDEAASVSFLFAISELLEARSSYRARNALAEIVALRPQYAHVLNPLTNETIVVPAEQVPVGSHISVRTGDKVAADGIVIEGTSAVDQSSLTGESLPLRVTDGCFVSGGSINIGDSQLIVRTTALVQDSAVSRLIQLVEEAQCNRSQTEKLIDGFARSYTPAVLSVALILATLPWFVSTDVGRYWTLNALILIVVACPCALTISTPVTYAAGLAACAQRGIVIKGGACFEAMGALNTVVFDKTGTITEGRFNVTNLEYIAPIMIPSNTGDQNTSSEIVSRQGMLELLALMEGPSSHPLSSTLVEAAKRDGSFTTLPLHLSMKDHTVLKGEGVTATVNHKHVYVGNQRLFERVGNNMYNSLPIDVKQRAIEWNAVGCTVGFIGVQDVGIIGCYSMVDKIRSESKEVIRQLKEKGINIVMLTGDGDGAANIVSKHLELPFDSVHSKLLPEDKLNFVRQLQSECKHAQGTNSKCTDNDKIQVQVQDLIPCSTNPCSKRKKSRTTVLFCGDGVNDAPALTAADVGVSMGENGAALALETSDVTLMDSNLSKLVFAIDMGEMVVQTIRENIVLSFLCKIVVVALTFCGYMTLLYAISSDVGVMLLVTINGMKLIPNPSSVSSGRIARSRSSGAYRSTMIYRKESKNADDDVECLVTSFDEENHSSSCNNDSEDASWFHRKNRTNGNLLEVEMGT